MEPAQPSISDAARHVREMAKAPKGIAAGSKKRTDYLLNKFGLHMYRLEQQGNDPTHGRDSWPA
jgi:hypothetical protein